MNVSGGETIDKWNKFCQKVAISAILDSSEKIGGSGKTVEIDESKFGKRNYNRGKRVEGQLVFWEN